MTTSTPWEATARVLRRASFGATGTDIDAAHAQGITTWVAATVSSETFAAAAAEARHTAPDVPMPAPKDHSATREAKRAANAAQRKAAEQVIAWWVERIWTTTTPVVEKITFAWHEHWATSVKKVKAGRLMLAQNLTLREHATGSFTTMATALTRDPALLHWLDAQKNTAKAPNENLARELMELFTLGQGHGYTETDVKEAARALTGWRIADDGTATFDAKRHDQGTKTVLAVTGNLGVEEVLAAILARPEHPIHLATRWWHRLASPTEPRADTLGRLLAAYGSGRDNGALLRAILTDPAFAAAPATNSLVVTPIEWTLGLVRALKVPLTDATRKHVREALTQLGQLPMVPPDVSGWPSGRAWLSTAAATVRLQAADHLVTAGDLSAVADAAATPDARSDAALHLLGLARVGTRTAAALAAAKTDPRALVTTLALSPEYLVN